MADTSSATKKDKKRSGKTKKIGKKTKQRSKRWLKKKEKKEEVKREEVKKEKKEKVEKKDGERTEEDEKRERDEGQREDIKIKERMRRERRERREREEREEREERTIIEERAATVIIERVARIDSEKRIAKEKKKKEMEKKEEEKTIANQNQIMNVVLGVIENIFSRLEMVVEPVARNLMFIDKLCLTLDFSIAGLQNAPIKMRPKTKERCDKVAKMLRVYLRGLIEWIQAPIYGQNEIKKTDQHSADQGGELKGENINATKERGKREREERVEERVSEEGATAINEQAVGIGGEDRIAREKKEKEEKEEEKKIDKQDQIMNMILGILENTFSRLEMVAEPAGRNVIFVYKLCLTLDFSITGLQNAPIKMRPKTKERSDKVVKMLRAYLRGLIEWIQSPIYGPDHPYGQNEMKKAAQRFAGRGGELTGGNIYQAEENGKNEGKEE